MSTESIKGARHLRNIRRRYDDLVAEFDGILPTSYARLRKFVVDIVTIVEEETKAAGHLPALPTDILKGKIIKKNITESIDDKDIMVRESQFNSIKEDGGNLSSLSDELKSAINCTSV